MAIYNDKLILFGGIQNITMEKNDLHLFDFHSKTWSCICGDNTTPENEKYDQKSQYSIDKHERLKISEQIDLQLMLCKKKKYSPLIQSN